jgi:hypothetical protein
MPLMHFNRRAINHYRLRADSLEHTLWYKIIAGSPPSPLLRMYTAKIERMLEKQHYTLCSFVPDFNSLVLYFELETAEGVAIIYSYDSYRHLCFKHELDEDALSLNQ